MMFELHYQMQIHFSSEVRHHQYLLRILPRRDRYVWEQMQLTIDQQAINLDHIPADGLGNALIIGQLLEPHRTFSVQLHAQLSPKTQLIDSLPPSLFGAHTALTYLSVEQAESWLTGVELPTDHYALAIALMACVFSQLQYQQGQTETHHPVAALLAQPVGVCQDFAHLLIALLRHCKLPARYVAGVAQGEGESHAWVEAWLGNQWLALDPTHHCVIAPDMPYIAFAIGRDSQDCPLNSGAFSGNAQQSLSIQAQLIQRY